MREGEKERVRTISFLLDYISYGGNLARPLPKYFFNKEQDYFAHITTRIQTLDALQRSKHVAPPIKFKFVKRSQSNHGIDP